jgi:peptide/nickel transport system permease protein
VLQALGVIVAVALISFAMFRFVGDPINQLVGQDTTPAQRAELRKDLGLDDPVVIQLGHFLLKAAHFDFGISYQFKRPVSQIMAERLPATLELSILSAIFALVVGVPMGVYTGLYPSRWLSRLFLSVSLIGVSLPTFLIGILKSLILPTITLGLFQMTLIMRLVRGEMLEVLRTDYIKFARARGLTRRAINFGHALKSTLVPVITITGLQLGSIVAFSIITETVFQWPGMGLLFLQAVQQVDIPIMAAYLMLVAVIFTVVNFAVDMLYVVVDPRVRIRGAQA